MVADRCVREHLLDVEWADSPWGVVFGAAEDMPAGPHMDLGRLCLMRMQQFDRPRFLCTFIFNVF